MALNPIPVADSIATIVKNAAATSSTPITDAQLKSMWEAIITALYTDITTHAQVTSTVVVTTGAGAPGTGTATGSIT